MGQCGSMSASGGLVVAAVPMGLKNHGYSNVYSKWEVNPDRKSIPTQVCANFKGYTPFAVASVIGVARACVARKTHTNVGRKTPNDHASSRSFKCNREIVTR